MHNFSSSFKLIKKKKKKKKNPYSNKNPFKEEMLSMLYKLQQKCLPYFKLSTVYCKWILASGNGCSI